jgi:hypothetical protein
MTTNKNANLFDDDVVAPTDIEPVVLEGPALRVVYFDGIDETPDGPVVVEDNRPCLVRCDDGQRNIKTVKRLATLCGRSCASATRTSGLPPNEGVTYCNACHALAGNGVLR